MCPIVRCIRGRDAENLLKGVQEGGRPEWDAVRRIAAKPENPGQGIAAMRAMGFSKDEKIGEETFDFILNQARDQDTFYYARGLQANVKTRHFLAEKVMEHFTEVWCGCCCIAGECLTSPMFVSCAVREAVRWELRPHPVDRGRCFLSTPLVV